MSNFDDCPFGDPASQFAEQVDIDRVTVNAGVDIIAELLSFCRREYPFPE